MARGALTPRGGPRYARAMERLARSSGRPPAPPRDATTASPRSRRSRTASWAPRPCSRRSRSASSPSWRRAPRISTSSRGGSGSSRGRSGPSSRRAWRRSSWSATGTATGTAPARSATWSATRAATSGTTTSGRSRRPSTPSSPRPARPCGAAGRRDVRGLPRRSGPGRGVHPRPARGLVRARVPPRQDPRRGLVHVPPGPRRRLGRLRDRDGAAARRSRRSWWTSRRSSPWPGRSSRRPDSPTGSAAWRGTSSPGPGRAGADLILLSYVVSSYGPADAAGPACPGPRVPAGRGRARHPRLRPPRGPPRPPQRGALVLREPCHLGLDAPAHGRRHHAGHVGRGLRGRGGAPPRPRHHVRVHGPSG